MLFFLLKNACISETSQLGRWEVGGYFSCQDISKYFSLLVVMGRSKYFFLKYFSKFLALTLWVSCKYLIATSFKTWTPEKFAQQAPSPAKAGLDS